MALMLPQERELILRAQDGDQSAFQKLIEIFSPLLYPVVRRYTQDELQAEAGMQETFWRAWRALDRYKFDKPFLPYLATIAANYQRDLWRKERRLFQLDLLDNDLPDPAPQPWEKIEMDDQLDALAVAIQRIPQHYRLILALRFDADMSYEEIAQSLELPLNTVRTHVRRAKNSIRRQMGDLDG